jgi:hypothetical protein
VAARSDNLTWFANLGLQHSVKTRISNPPEVSHAT